MTHKRNARAPRPDPAAQDPMDYLLDDVMQATDKVATELREMADLEADPLATLAGHCHTLAGRVAALAEVVRQMRDLQRGLVVISDPPMPAPVLITDARLAELDLADAQRGQAERTLVRWRLGDNGLEPVYADQDLASDEQIRAHRAAGLGRLGADQDLAAGVDPAEVRDGQYVGRRRGEGEGDDHHALGHVAIGARLKRQCSTTGGDAQASAWCNSHAFHIVWVETCNRLRLQGVQRGGAARHGARGPVLQHAASGQHHRELGIGQLIGRAQFGRHDLRAARFGRERLGEDDLVAGLVWSIARVGDSAFALQPLPGDVLERGHHARHLGKHVGGMAVVPRQPDAPGNFLDPHPVLACVPGQRDRKSGV